MRLDGENGIEAVDGQRPQAIGGRSGGRAALAACAASVAMQGRWAPAEDPDGDSDVLHPKPAQLGTDVAKREQSPT